MTRGSDVWWTDASVQTSELSEQQDQNDDLIEPWRQHPGWHIVQQRCVQCHRSTSSYGGKGGLALDVLAGWEQGGERDGAGVVWGNASASPIWERTQREPHGSHHWIH